MTAAEKSADEEKSCRAPRASLGLRDQNHNTDICIEHHSRIGHETTLDLNDSLLTQAKALAAQQRTSLTRLIEEGLQLRLKSKPGPAKPVRLPVFRGKGGLAGGLSGLSNKELLDAADRDA